MIEYFNRRNFIKTAVSVLAGLKLCLYSKIKIFAQSVSDNPTWIAYLETVLPFYNKWEFEETRQKLGETFDNGVFSKISAVLDQISDQRFGKAFHRLDDIEKQTAVLKKADEMDRDLHLLFRRQVIQTHATRAMCYKFLGYDEDTKSELFICDLQFETYTEPLYRSEEIPAEALRSIIPPKMREEFDRLKAVRESWDVNYPGEKFKLNP